MKTCKDISELLSEGMDRPLTWQERLSVRIHFFMCKSCPRFLDQVQFLRKSARRFKSDERN